MKDDKREDRKHRQVAGGPVVQTSHYGGPPFRREDLEEAMRLRAQGSAPPVVCFDDELQPRDNSSLLHRAKLLQADMIQRCAENDQDVARIGAAFDELYLFLGGDR